MIFALFMVVILLVTGLIWLFDSLLLKKKRPVGAAESVAVEYAKSFFPVIFVVFFVRSFIVEPFKIPSGSMMPTLLAGDYILVNKFTYGIRMPIFNNVLFEVNQPKRGDVFVFHYPSAPSVDYIKRVIALPGDKVTYQDKQLTINGKHLDVQESGSYKYLVPNLDFRTAKQLSEKLGDVQHDILNDDVPTRCNPPDMPVKSVIDVIAEAAIQVQPISDGICQKFSRNDEIVVPAGHYLAMGDNRDNSSDSRMWGFVPERNLVGKAFFIWMNFDETTRIGKSIH
jgi:signal peptidase I